MSRNFRPGAPSLVTLFPGLLGNIRIDLGASGIDPAIVELVMISFISLLTQGCADVRWPNGQIAPVGVSCLLVAPSSSGKSVIFNVLCQAVNQFMHDAMLDGKLPVKPDFLLEDATRTAIIEFLRDWSVAGLFSDEAGLLKELLRDAASTLAKLLDGSPLRYARAKTGRIELIGHRLVMLLMEQPSVFEASKVLLGASKGGVGLANRFLFGQAKTVAPSASLHKIGLSETVRHQYVERVYHLLQRSALHVIEKSTRPALCLSPEAAHFFIGLGDEMSRKLSLDQRAADIREYVNRHSERVLRLAGAIHVFEFGTESEIQLSTVQLADSICRESIDAFAEMTHVPPTPTQAEKDAHVVHQALLQSVASTGYSRFKLADLRRWAINLGLTPHRFNRAVPVLAGSGYVTVFQDGRTDYLQLNYPHSRLIY